MLFVDNTFNYVAGMLLLSVISFGTGLLLGSLWLL
jgi:hypothetical protein